MAFRALSPQDEMHLRENPHNALCIAPTTPSSSPQPLSCIARNGYTLFNDPIHDCFQLSPLSCTMLDTAAFTRLRNLKQLGCTYFVYPGASHNRFEHSLGVAHLSGLWSRTLLESYPHEERERFSALVELAGLCHDLGHGPFSHVWEKYVLPALGVKDWHHEEMSLQMIDYVFEDQEIEERFGLTRKERRLVQDLVIGKKPLPLQHMYGDFPLYLFDIVNNQANGFDVDKFDYLQRDSFHTNVQVSAPYKRLLHFAKGVGNSIAYRVSERRNVRKVFEDRMTLHRDVYTHKTGRSIDLMISDALREIGPELNLKTWTCDPQQFLKLNDGLLDVVHYWHPSQSHAAHRARALLDRIASRDLYVLCGAVYIPQDRLSEIQQKFEDRILANDIVSHQTVDGQVRLSIKKCEMFKCVGKVNLYPNDVHVSLVYIDCGLKQRDPIDEMMFYQERPHEHEAIENMVETCQWMWLRIYCKNPDEERATRCAFEAWRKFFFGSSFRTPEKSERPSLTDHLMSD